MKKIILPALLLVLALGMVDSVFAQKVKLRSRINPACATSSSQKFADIYADGNLAVVGSFQCRGVFIVDVSNPDNPVLSSWYNPAPGLQFLEAIVIGDRGYFGAGGGTDGVHIVDLTNPTVPFLLGKVNGTNGGHNTIHEMMVFDHGGARYLLENSNSTGTTNLRIINVTDPGAPVLKWTFTPGGWVHAMHIRGNKMYLSGFFGTNQVYIYDITNLATQTPALLGAVQVGAGSNHSAWTDESGNYLYSARETSNGNLQVYNVSNPASPLLIRNIRAADLNINAITPHNPVVMGNKLYVAWYQGGTQVFDITDPSTPVRVGQYDTYPNEFSQTEAEKELIDNSAEPWDIMCGSDSLGNALPTGFGGNWAVYPFLGEDKVLLGDMATGLYVVDATHATAAPKNVISDFDGDGKTDLSTYRPSTGTWSVIQSGDGSTTATDWGGLAGDIAVNGDYDGDGETDNAIFRPSTGTWWFIYSSNGLRPAIQFGLNGDVPVPADYDADGKADLAIWRPSTGVWYINQSTLGMRYLTWGLNGDKPVVGDYEGDGKTDIAIWRPSNGVWYVMQSSSSIPIYVSFGMNGDRPLFADFTGDGRSEFSIYRPSTGVWYWLNPALNTTAAYQFGISEDAPIPADFDGDGKADISVFRPSSNVWYRLNSADSTFSIVPFGQNGDAPSPGLIQPQ